MQNDRPLILKKVKVHNLKDVDLTLQPNQLIVFTGVSGSGKSSLAFDTIYIEGQRRYVESLSTFARRYLGDLVKPDLEHASNLSPTISIEQKTAGKNPRSTVGTMTEIYDYLRVLYARIATPFCPVSKEPVSPQSKERIIKSIQLLPEGTKLIILSPFARGKKAEFTQDFEQLIRKGFMRVRLDGVIKDLEEIEPLDGNIAHDVDVIIDRIIINAENASRISDSLTTALEMGSGLCSIIDVASDKETLFSTHAYSPTSGIYYEALQPHDFSFNSPHGMCPRCLGLGIVEEFDLDLVIDPEKSIEEDCCSVASSYQTVRFGNIYDNLAKLYKFSVSTPWKDLSDKAKDVFLNGSEKKWLRMEFVHPVTGSTWSDYISWKGVLHEAKTRFTEAKSDSYQKRMQKLMTKQLCPACNGSRLKPYPSEAQLDGKKIAEITTLTVEECYSFFKSIKLSKDELLIADELLKEIRERLRFLLDVGLHYLTLDRIAPTLSGGEAQRVRLASQIGSGLVGVTYVLDEPSIGLHPRDNTRLIKTLKHLRDLGNTVIVVEHDEETILSADHVVDFGPGPGSNGGKVVFQGSVKDLLKNKESLTAGYLSGRLKIPFSKKRRKPTKATLEIKGATHHNLKNINVSLPLGLFVAVTGVSGSGKSSLISDILHPYLANHFHLAEMPVGKVKEIQGLENIDKVICIDQSPIGRIPRSNPATYIKVFDDIRNLFTSLPESLARGYQPGQFSFNVKTGSCPKCEGMGMLKIDMDFMEDEWVTCDSCNGKRFDQDTLSVLYKGKTIADVLSMPVKEAHEFFSAIPPIFHKLEMLMKVGMEYIQLGQPSPTLSGGEAQRIKLAKELWGLSTGKTLYILDEPTTGLHFHDIKHLLDVLHELVNKGNTVVVIEHNMDVVKTADWIIDLGPEGGSGGGKIVATGSPEQILKLDTPTAHALSNAINNSYLQNIAPAKIETQSIKTISVQDAEQHNLKRISLEIPRESITICTGPSGSGKSSLAFDTIYAEGQRRYIEALSPYARQFVQQMPKPKVGMINGLSPAIAIEQKAHAGNPRSTVGTLTEIYDYLRVLYARAGIAYCPETGEEIRSISKDFVAKKILSLPQGTPIYILAPLELSKQDSFEELTSRLSKKGYVRIYLNGDFYELDGPIPFERGRKNKVSLVIDRLKVGTNIDQRLFEAISSASDLSKGQVECLYEHDGKKELLFFNLTFSVASTGKSYASITPQSFAFNTQEGMCPDCLGLGTQYGANLEKLPEIAHLTVVGLLSQIWRLSSYKNVYKILAELKSFFKEEKIDVDAELMELPPKALQILMNGSPADKWYSHPSGFRFQWQGINASLARAGHKAHYLIKEKLVPLLEEIPCVTCRGSRLNALASNVRLNKLTMQEICELPVGETLNFVEELTCESILDEVMKQLKSRLHFLTEVGLHYMALSRKAPTLSNGEAQRIRLARQLGSGLTGVLYVLDEPTIGLHPRETHLLNQSLKKLKALGNTLLLVEHDPETLAIADYIVDMGPKAGFEGGHIMARGTLTEILENPKSLTGAYLSGRKSIELPKKRRKASDRLLRIENARIHNLKNISISFPLGLLSCITGVSGSGKSTLMHDVIAPLMKMGLLNQDEVKTPYAIISGIEQFDKLITIDQNPIGHTVRSDVVTYVEALTPMREFFAKLPLSRSLGLQPKHFSYNHKAGMCTGCFGLGFKRIEMHFLPAVQITCPDCRGMRLNPRSLSVIYMEKSMGQILQLTVDEALIFFDAHPKIKRILETLTSVGLGYLKLGQEIATLSGGEAQRMKLSRELAKRSTGKTLYLLDEPTTGLHSDDINKLLGVLQKLVDKGNTMIIIEHQMDVIKSADFIVDLGPEGGEGGGKIVATGTPEEIIKSKKSLTAPYLKKAL